MNLIVPHGFEPNYTVGLVKGLVKQGVHLCVAASNADEAALRSAGIAHANCRGSGSADRSAMSKVVNLLAYYAKLLAMVWRHGRTTTHFTGIFRSELILLEGLLLPTVFRLLSQQYIYTAHNLLPHGKRQDRLFRWVYKIIYAMPHRIVVHTALMKQRLTQEFGVAEQKVTVSSIGLNEEIPVSSLTASEARAQFQWPPGELVVLMFGKANPYKGIETLVGAIEQLPLATAVRLVIVGEFIDPEYRLRIRALIAASPMRQAIELHDRAIPDQQVERWFKAADVLALPYREIDQSGVLFLGMRFGIPVVATDVGAFREFVASGVGLIAARNDAAGLSETLRAFVLQRSAFDRDAISRHAQHYRWEVVCRNLVPLYT